MSCEAIIGVYSGKHDTAEAAQSALSDLQNQLEQSAYNLRVSNKAPFGISADFYCSGKENCLALKLKRLNVTPSSITNSCVNSEV
jgi:hypothetical protein